MKKTFSIGMVTLCFVIWQCSNSNSYDNVKKNIPESIQVDGTTYLNFATKISDAFATLKENDQKLLKAYGDKMTADNKTSRTEYLKSTCNCSQTQTNCSAETWYADCCICCNSGSVTACSTFGPLAFCKCVTPSEGAKESMIVAKNVVFYPTRFSQMLLFAKDNNINIDAMQVVFDSFLKEETK